eukprot:gene615-2046_t
MLARSRANCSLNCSGPRVAIHAGRRNRVSTPAAVSEPAALESSKAKILLASGTQSGYDLNDGARQAIETAVKELEGSGPLDRDWAKDLEGTTWIPVYNNSQGPSGGKIGPFLSVVTQEFPADEPGTYKNFSQIGLVTVSLCGVYRVNKEEPSKIDLEFKSQAISIGPFKMAEKVQVALAISGDPRRPNDVYPYVPPITDTEAAPDAMVMVATLVGLAGLWMKVRVVSWFSMFMVLSQFAIMKSNPAGSDSRQLMMTLVILSKGRVRTKTVKKASRVIIEKYYGRLTQDFDTNKRVCAEVAIIQSKRLRNKISGFTTHLMKRIQRGPVRGISLKLQEEERERRLDFVPDESALNTSSIEVDRDTMDMLKAMGMGSLAGVVQQAATGNASAPFVPGAGYANAPRGVKA